MDWMAYLTWSRSVGSDSSNRSKVRTSLDLNSLSEIVVALQLGREGQRDRGTAMTTLGLAVYDEGNVLGKRLVHLLLLQAMSGKGFKACGDHEQGGWDRLASSRRRLGLNMCLEGTELLLLLGETFHVIGKVVKNLVNISIRILGLCR